MIVSIILYLFRHLIILDDHDHKYYRNKIKNVISMTSKYFYNQYKLYGVDQSLKKTAAINN